MRHLFHNQNWMNKIVCLIEGLNLRLKAQSLANLINNNPFSAILTCGIVVIILASLLITPQGRIIPLGKEMSAAYELLKSTESGRALIRKVEKSTRGTLVYMMLGNTKDDELRDYHGLKVRGVTRSYFESFDYIYTPTGVLIYTNRDLTQGRPQEIVKNIAFELENVIYAMQYPAIEFGKDSPFAPITQKQVCMELGL